ncbi:MAG: DoxX family protein [Propionicimonas sp.]|uniref:DoxX family protein n=1 Tax=Propionicimonas sp. TaxID=1955623 RepID=UPI002B1F38E6|nr:DoxX family protein [Propionicimonas sp.]MEA4944122.1 DoxX family protein [Propionicimonas sp.]MEA5052157.1 DoxX family protein [Propionicimonas sp.]MEA5118749.1 DoxX family protein [Propionicimonas sp.]
MTILRAFARTMLASYFVAHGVKAWRNPETLTEAAEPVTEKVLPVAKSVLPRQLAAYLPTDNAGVVKVWGAAQVLGGLALATGLGRRLGAGVLAGSMLPQVLAANPLKAPAGEREEVFGTLSKNVALLGGVALAAMDTEGKPNLAWRAQAHREATARATAQTERAAKTAKKRARQRKARESVRP